MLGTSSGPRLRHWKRTLYGEGKNAASMRVAARSMHRLAGGIFVNTRGATRRPKQEDPPIVVELPRLMHRHGCSSAAVAHRDVQHALWSDCNAFHFAADGGKLCAEVDGRSLEPFYGAGSSGTGGGGETGTAPALQVQRGSGAVKAKGAKRKRSLAAWAPFVLGQGCAHVRCRVHSDAGIGWGWCLTQMPGAQVRARIARCSSK